MRISIALCTYNGAPYLGDQLLSIAGQQRLPDDLVICDDGSQDETRQIAEAFASDVVFAVQYHQNAHNLGSTRNFDQAIQLCRGDVIALCDQDDYWYPDKLSAIEDAFSRDPKIGMVFSDADVVDAQRQELGYTLWQSVRFDPHQQKLASSGQIFPVLLRHPVVTGTTMAFRSQFRELISPIAPSWIHDEWIALLIAIAAEVRIIPRPLLQYRRHAVNQVGAESVNLRARLNTALRTNPTIYQARQAQYQALYDHVAQRLPSEETALAELTHKLEHLRVRGTLPRQNVRRILPVLRELASGHYQRYSGSPLNAIRDLLLRHQPVATSPPS